MTIKKKQKEIVSTDVDRKFFEAVKLLREKRIAGSNKEIADKIGWNATDFSSAKNGYLNVPDHHIKSLEKIYGVKIITAIQDDLIGDLIKRISKLEAQGEIYETILGDLLKSVNGKSSNTNISEIRQEVLDRVRSNWGTIPKK